jgi:hypothetical protein
MKKTISILSLILTFNCVVFNNLAISQPPIEWQKCYGGKYNEYATSFIKTKDSGFILTGSTNSYDGDVTRNHPKAYDEEVWVVKLNAYGKITWQMSYGGTDVDKAHSIIETSDGCYLFAGATGSIDGDIKGLHNGIDALIIKIDSSGKIIWQKCFGGSQYDEIYKIIQTRDSNFIAVGITESNDGDVLGNHNKQDAWIVKFDSYGRIIWQKCLGGSQRDEAKCVIETNEGDYLIVGSTYSSDGDVITSHGIYNMEGWIVKLNSNGKLLWQKCIGGSKNEYLNCISITTDGGFIVSGYTNSNDGDLSGNNGNISNDNYNYWVIKFNLDDQIEWQKCYSCGGGYTTISETIDGGYIFAATASLNGGDISGFHGGYDYWIAKLNKFGQIQWQKCFGGSLYDDAQSIAETKDNGYIITGDIESNDGDVVGLHGLTDGWVLKLNNEGQIQWQKCLGGKDEDWTTSIIESKNGGFVVSGYSQSNDGDAITRQKRYGDIWVVKLNPFTDVEEKTSEKIFEISPNPASDFIELSVGTRRAVSDQSDVRIFDVLGEIQTTPNPTPTLPASGEGVRLDVSGLAPGMYFVRIGESVQKFIKL